MILFSFSLEFSLLRGLFVFMLVDWSLSDCKMVSSQVSCSNLQTNFVMPSHYVVPTIVVLFLTMAITQKLNVIKNAFLPDEGVTLHNVTSIEHISQSLVIETPSNKLIFIELSITIDIQQFECFSGSLQSSIL